MNAVLKRLLQFREERNWKQFNSPQNIAKSIVLEAAEILEVFQWKNENSQLTRKEKEQLAEEIADVYNWLLLLTHDLDMDINQIALSKIDKNAKKYPVSKVRGKTTKYTEI